LALIFIALLASVAAAFFLGPDAEGLSAALVFGAFFAMACAVFCLALALGFLQWPRQAAKDDVARLICDGSSESLLVTAAGGRLIYANGAYLALAGARSLLDARPAEHLFSSSLEASESIYRLAQAAREGKAAAEELRVSPPLKGRGEAAWYRITVRPLPLPGIRRATLWSVADVSREREDQERVFQELRRAIDFLDHAPAGFFSSSPKGDVTFMNATLASWLGHDLSQSQAKPCRLVDFLPRDAAQRIAAFSGNPSETGTLQIDTSLKCQDGQTVPVRLLHSAGFGPEGEPQALRTLVLNRARGGGQAQGEGSGEAHFARIFDATPIAVAILGKDGRILRSNAAFGRLMPHALKPAGGAKPSIFAGVLDRDHAVLEAALAAAFQPSPDVPPVDVGLAGDTERSARLFLAAAGEQGENGVTVYALDTTEQRALQSNFAQSQKMQAIGQLAGGMAHDFNNVLTAIIGHADLLLANHRPTDPSFRDINQIKQNANRAASLVRQLLAFSRRQTLRPQVLQLGDVLSDLQMMMRRLVGEKIDLELRHGRDLWLVKADLNQFEQVLVNLIVNARDAMPKGGKIILRTRNVAASGCGSFNDPSLVPADYVAVEVEDFGQGIPPEIKDKIFEPFFTTKEVGKGTGLGLAMVYGIVRQTGGYVFCSSETGKGTVFTILLPRYIASETPAPPAQESAQAPPADLTGHGTILLVEDEEAVRAFAARALATRGYTVLQASSGTEALQIVEQDPAKIDLVVSDVVMPEMDGPTMFGELRKRGVKAKVIFVSGYAEEAFAKNLPEGEDFGFLPKPFTLKQLIEAVKGRQ
jgi:two-component system cell cycle sensor histidine kinase/response regulator CckA